MEDLRTATSTARNRSRTRSRAWIYYTVLAVLSLVAAIAGTVSALVGVLVFGGYAVYIYRGGRYVFWLW